MLPFSYNLSSISPPLPYFVFWNVENLFSHHPYVHSCQLLLDHVQFALIHEPNIPGSYAVWFFTTLHFTFSPRHIHKRALFLLRPNSLVPSGAIGDCPLLFPSSILGTFPPGGFILWHHIFLSLNTVDGVLAVRIRERFAIPSSSGPCSVITLHYDPSVLGGPSWHGF